MAEKLVLINYDQESRKNEIEKILRAELEKLSKQNAIKPAQILKEVTDVLKLQVDEMTEKVETLDADIKAYENGEGHFTKQFRSLRERIVRYQVKLDAIDVMGHDDLREMRRQALAKLNNLAKELEGKSHDTGSPCPDCELQNI